MFESILEGPPYDLAIETRSDGVGHIISVPIARDEYERIVFVETLLSPVVIDEFVHHEIVFQISVVAMDDSFEAFTTQEREPAKPFIPDGCRNNVMDIVCRSIEKLINTANPTLLYAVTKESELPPKAMEKYDVLMNAVQNCGYTTYEVGTDTFGRAFWKLTAPYSPD